MQRRRDAMSSWIFSSQRLCAFRLQGQRLVPDSNGGVLPGGWRVPGQVLRFVLTNAYA